MVAREWRLFRPTKEMRALAFLVAEKGLTVAMLDSRYKAMSESEKVWFRAWLGRNRDDIVRTRLITILPDGMATVDRKQFRNGAVGRKALK
jgi:hypothetical protein